MRYDDVKPCPFCGCPSVTVKAISGYYRAKCNGCESRTGYGGSEKEAGVSREQKVKLINFNCEKLLSS
ncbi:type I toxin-antitoxin system endodeoxyribonuclease toxin RalR [Escherichia coli]|nr:type I toxin-antitoxin system endodeoxyribonuclease toxin RalR [Escherichia coli]EIH9929985.1 type I toxin-antitoxin system endodeoxyribonuclease toxin RalR [Escherichia coli]